MRLLLLPLIALAVVRAEYDDSLKCTVCTKVANYIIPAIREAGSDAVDNVCDTFTSDSIRSACGQIVGTGWSMIVNWVKYRKAGPRDICVSVSFCENGGRDFEKEDAQNGGHDGGNRDHDVGSGGVGSGGVGDERGHVNGGSNGNNGNNGRDGLNGRDEDRTSVDHDRAGDRSRSQSPDRTSGGGDLNFGDIDAERERQAERERNEELGRGRREAVQRYRNLMAQPLRAMKSREEQTLRA
ncbi:unnamed protein product [Bursaphelenchus xylophilus]|uniref:(pine wood nematode) hypothetical protein n=1 Tax=Bursaphelenchus xylophilus TaxID=6326 RepID=A0A7I8WUR5_BURXY|nr:unnamed protein product [Bursaphelenchus xylophilus]CAG9116685.1 unnamed protein product [Bursaphelenchus xylophilus]